MSRTVRRAIEGRYPSCYNPSRFAERRGFNRALKSLDNQQSKPDVARCLESETEAHTPAQQHRILSTSYNWVDYLRSREIQAPEPRSVDPSYGTRHMITNEMFRETPISLGHMDKVLCSQWLLDRQIVFGTKCNNLMLYDVRRRSLNGIPTLHGRQPLQQELQTGIRALKINPSRTLLATNARNSCELAIYSLPTLDPVYIGEGHNDCILDICWLDDELLGTGSRDSKIALWRAPPPPSQQPVAAPQHDYIQPSCIKECSLGQEVRALTFIEKRREIMALTKNGINVFDAGTFSKKNSHKLQLQDITCLAAQHESDVYAIGTKTYLNLLDYRTMTFMFRFCCSRGWVGSVSFRGNIITLGLGLFNLAFHDMRSGNFIKNSSNNVIKLKTSRGYLAFEEDSWDDRDDVLIHTHCYDESGTRLFTAGGPRGPSFIGNYAAIWQ